ncbi:MAG TPA: hypothetical protein VGX23_07310 [Actinocrinis sp.]|nr:hypothetical protein [Actinocrinis sp.]
MSANRARRRNPLRLLAKATAAMLAVPLLTVLAAAPAHAASSPGAPVAFTEYNAATSSNVTTNGTVLAPNYDFGTIESEATGCQAVELLGASDSVSSVVVNLPPSSSWGSRTQTFSVLGSTNGSTYSTLVGSATYTFNPATGNTVSITLPAGTSDRYVQPSFTANNVQNGAQLSEFQIFG